MNDGGYWGFPMHGAITDVNIWSRVLSPSQISDWSLCTNRTFVGDLVDWNTAELNISKLDVVDVDYDWILNNACSLSSPPTISAFRAQKNIEDTKTFCKNIGGNIAVAKDAETFQLMNKSFSTICEDEKFYSGHKDYDADGQFEEAEGGAAMGWTAWKLGEPDRGTGEHCVTFSKEWEQFTVYR